MKISTMNKIFTRNFSKLAHFDSVYHSHSLYVCERDSRHLLVIYNVIKKRWQIVTICVYVYAVLASLVQMANNKKSLCGFGHMYMCTRTYLFSNKIYYMNGAIHVVCLCLRFLLKKKTWINFSSIRLYIVASFFSFSFLFSLCLLTSTSFDSQNSFELNYAIGMKELSHSHLVGVDSAPFFPHNFPLYPHE